MNVQASPPDTPVGGRCGFLDFEESVRSSKVLQGQENVGLVSPFYGSNKAHRPVDFGMQSIACQSLTSNGIEGTKFGEFVRNQPSTTYSGFVESNRFPKVLQGQEICSLRSLTGKTDLNLGSWRKSDLGCNFLNMNQRPTPSCYPLASEGVRNIFIPYNDIYRAGQDPLMYSYRTNIPREKVPFNPTSFQSGVMMDEVKRPPEVISAPLNLEANFKSQKDDTLKGLVSCCKLFGFPLNEEIPSSTQRNRTKVHKQGNLVGRAIDLSKLNGYDDLLIELEKLFNMVGLLRDPDKGWRIVYTDSENDLMIVGDDPWDEFCNVVSKIHIYTQEEVEQMTAQVMLDDTQSCLEEAPAVMGCRSIHQ
ncbi:unnamed protein product [Ilex paraguariensis]|uniref:Auxin-responsive protein n=1 Tax=Ilex paraguariensis TaxID=185542 RepID=A0ABC8RE24_9AQUA